MRILVRRIAFWALLSAAMMPFTVQAQDQARLFLEAVKAYEQGDYTTAAQGFLSIAQGGVINGKLYYNVANAFFKAGDIGRAILWYEKAHRLMPNDPDLKYNLEYARSQVKDKTPDNISLPEMLFFWRDWLGQRMVVVLAAAFSAIFCLAMFAGKRLALNVPAFVRYGALTLFILFTLTAGGDYYFDYSLRQGVVLSESVSATSGFSDLSTELFVLHAGSRVTIEQVQKDFCRIRFGRDKIGWVSREKIGVI